MARAIAANKFKKSKLNQRGFYSSLVNYYLLKKLSFTYPAKLRFNCNRCGLCCGDTKEKTRHILLLEEEAQTIAAKTALSKQDFSLEISDKHPYCFEMKKTSEGKCIFLKDNHCTIYSLRPLICRFYPFELKFDPDQEQHAFSFTLECPAMLRGEILGKNFFLRLFGLAKDRLKC